MNVKDMDMGMGKAEVSNIKNYYRNVRKRRKMRNSETQEKFPREGWISEREKNLLLWNFSRARAETTEAVPRLAHSSVYHRGNNGGTTGSVCSSGSTR